MAWQESLSRSSRSEQLNNAEDSKQTGGSFNTNFKYNSDQILKNTNISEPYMPVGSNLQQTNASSSGLHLSAWSRKEPDISLENIQPFGKLNSLLLSSLAGNAGRRNSVLITDSSSELHNVSFYSYFNRIVNVWNIFPNSEIKHISGSKHKLSNRQRYIVYTTVRFVNHATWLTTLEGRPLYFCRFYWFGK